MSAHKITDREPVFPCWMYDNFCEVWWRKDTFPSAAIPGTYTHWHEDQPTAPTCVPGEADEYRNLTPEAAAEHEAQPTPEAVPLVTFRAYPNLEAIISGTISGKYSDWCAVRGELTRFVADTLALRHAAPPVGEVTPNKGDGKARYIVVPRDEAITYAAYCSGMSGKSIRVAENTVPEFIECAKKLGLEPTECAAMRSGREGEKS